MSRRRLASAFLLMALLGVILAGCKAAPPQPLIPEDFLEETDIPYLEEACYTVLEKTIPSYVDILNAVARSQALSKEDVTFNNVELLPHVYSFYEKTDSGDYVNCLAIAFTHEVHIKETSETPAADESSYNFLILHAPSRNKDGTLHASFSLEQDVPQTTGWVEREHLFLGHHCTNGRSILISEYSDGKVTRSSFDFDDFVEYVTGKHS